MLGAIMKAKTSTSCTILNTLFRTNEFTTSAVKKSCKGSQVSRTKSRNVLYQVRVVDPEVVYGLDDDDQYATHSRLRAHVLEKRAALHGDIAEARTGSVGR